MLVLYKTILEKNVKWMPEFMTFDTSNNLKILDDIYFLNEDEVPGLLDIHYLIQLQVSFLH